MFKAIFFSVGFSCLVATAEAESVCSRFQGLRIPVILGYHDIVNDKIGNSSDITFGEFTTQIKELQSKGYRFASLEDFHRLAALGHNLPPKTIILTFDDGYEGQWAAYKFLKEKNIPATFFSITKHIGVPTSRQNMSLEQLREIDRDPLFSVHSHTETHADLRKVADKKKIESELTGSAAELRAKLDRPATEPMFLAYPLGSVDVRAAKVAAASYAMAFGYTTEPVISTDPDYASSFDVRIDPCLQIPRFTVGQRFKDPADLIKALPAYVEELRMFERMTAHFQRERRNFLKRFTSTSVKLVRKLVPGERFDDQQVTATAFEEIAPGPH